MKRPLVLFAIIYIFGIITTKFLKINFWLVYLLAVTFIAVLFFAFRKEKIFNIIICCLVFLFGMARFKNSDARPACNISNYITYAIKSPYILKGYINSNPSKINGSIVFVFNARQMQAGNLAHNCCGNVLVRAKAVEGLRYGEVLILEGNLYRPFGGNKTGRMNYRNYLYAQGIRAIMNIKSSSQVIKLNRNCGLKIKRLAFWLKGSFERIIYKYLNGIPAGVLDAMVLGEKKGIPEPINNSMIKSGTIHIFVVSGFNVGIAAFIIILFLKLFRLPRKLRLWIACFLLVVYCLMTGASTPVVRATIMAVIFILSYLFKRLPDIYNSCAIAIIIILAVNPQQLFDIGFQLSFASVISIIFFYQQIKVLLKLDLIKVKLFRFLADGVLVSFSAWLGTMGFIAYYFKIICPVTVFANLFIVPLASVITLCGFSLAILHFISPLLAGLCASTTELIIIFLLNLNNFMIKIPLAYFYLK